MGWIGIAMTAISKERERTARQGSNKRFAPNVVLLTLSLGLLVLLWSVDSVSIAPNRIVPGSGFTLWQALGLPGALLVSVLIAALAALTLTPQKRFYSAQLTIIALLLLLMPFGLMVAGALLIEPDMPQARLGVSSGFWCLLFVMLLALVEVRLRLELSRLWPALLLCFVAAVWWLCALSWLDHVALVQEFKARDAQFMRALQQHLVLVGVSVSLSVLLGLALALAMRRFSRLNRLGFALLNFVQTIPSLALFGLLLAPLAWLASQVPLLARLGVSGIGMAPALIALVAYSLLPMVRNTYTALDEVDKATLEAATAMGMRSAQRFWQVRLPLALPVLIEGVRITAVQAIGLATVAALIGAGGLGTFIFQGLGQAAMDMVLLGALPILVLALLVDASLGALAERLRPEGMQ